MGKLEISWELAHERAPRPQTLAPREKDKLIIIEMVKSVHRTTQFGV